MKSIIWTYSAQVCTVLVQVKKMIFPEKRRYKQDKGACHIGGSLSSQWVYKLALQFPLTGGFSKHLVVIRGQGDKGQGICRDLITSLNISTSETRQTGMRLCSELLTSPNIQVLSTREKGSLLYGFIYQKGICFPQHVTMRKHKHLALVFKMT